MAGSAFPSQNSKKNTIIGALLEAEMIKKRTPTQREGDRERVRERERLRASTIFRSIRSSVGSLYDVSQKPRLSHSFLSLKLLPPPCAVLLTGRYEKIICQCVYIYIYTYIYIYNIYIYTIYIYIQYIYIYYIYIYTIYIYTIYIYIYNI